MNEDRESFLGLRISAALLVAMGCIFALYVLLLGVALGISVVNRWHGQPPASDEARWFLFLLIGLPTTAALTYLSFRAAAALRNARRWAAYVAMGFGLILLWFSGEFFYDWFHPERQGPDDGWGIFIVPFWVALGLWWCIYLNLPHVRAHLRSVR